MPTNRNKAVYAININPLFTIAEKFSSEPGTVTPSTPFT